MRQKQFNQNNNMTMEKKELLSTKTVSLSLFNTNK